MSDAEIVLDLPECHCPDQYPKYVEYDACDAPASSEEQRADRWIRVLKHTGDCERHDSVEIKNGGVWRTVV